MYMLKVEVVYLCSVPTENKVYLSNIWVKIISNVFMNASESRFNTLAFVIGHLRKSA